MYPPRMQVVGPVSTFVNIMVTTNNTPSNPQVILNQKLTGFYWVSLSEVITIQTISLAAEFYWNLMGV